MDDHDQRILNGWRAIANVRPPAPSPTIERAALCTLIDLLDRNIKSLELQIDVLERQVVRLLAECDDYRQRLRWPNNNDIQPPPDV